MWLVVRNSETLTLVWNLKFYCSKTTRIQIFSVSLISLFLLCFAAAFTFTWNISYSRLLTWIHHHKSKENNNWLLNSFFIRKIFSAVKFSLSRLVPGHNGLTDNLSESHERCENWAKYTIHLYPINTQPYQQHSLQLVSARVNRAEKRSGPLKHSLLTQWRTETSAKR